jgi:nucleoside-diphosphate-sugar epimerase
MATKSKPDGNKIKENDAIGDLKKGDSYAISKRIIEKEIELLHKDYPEKRFIIARIGPISGSYDRIVLPKIVAVMGKKRLPKLIDKGKRKMSIISPEDVAAAMVFIAKKSQNSSVYNVTGDMITYKEMFECVAEYYGIKPPRFSIPFWLFKALRPVIWLIRVLFSKSSLVKLVLSETALAFFSNNYEYDRSKLEQLGYSLRFSPVESLERGLLTMDPEKTLIS